MTAVICLSVQSSEIGQQIQINQIQLDGNAHSIGKTIQTGWTVRILSGGTPYGIGAIVGIVQGQAAKVEVDFGLGCKGGQGGGVHQVDVIHGCGGVVAIHGSHSHTVSIHPVVVAAHQRHNGVGVQVKWYSSMHPQNKNLQPP